MGRRCAGLSRWKPRQLLAEFDRVDPTFPIGGECRGIQRYPFEHRALIIRRARKQVRHLEEFVTLGLGFAHRRHS